VPTNEPCISPTVLPASSPVTTHAPDHSAIAAQFMARYGSPPEHIAWAPGRINLIGEHTDYNGGWVLPTPLHLGTFVALRSLPGGQVEAHSTAEGTAHADCHTLAPRGHWLDYPMGMLAQLGGSPTPGAQLLVASNLPGGSGLSSSAALCIAFGRAWRQAKGLSIDDIQLARHAQACENDFVGAAVGIMDPMVISVGRPHCALLLNCQTLEHQHIELPAALQFAVVHSGISHHNVSGGYSTRRRECEAAAAALHLNTLAELPVDRLHEATQLAAPLGDRAIHVVEENARVGAMVAALAVADYRTAGSLCQASHASLRDRFAVSLPQIDALVEAAAGLPGVLGARLMGGGFGGCVLLICHAGQAAGAARAASSRCPQSYLVCCSPE
jgi:galactokinase